MVGERSPNGGRKVSMRSTHRDDRSFHCLSQWDIDKQDKSTGEFSRTRPDDILPTMQRSLIVLPLNTDWVDKLEESRQNPWSRKTSPVPTCDRRRCIGAILSTEQGLRFVESSREKTTLIGLTRNAERMPKLLMAGNPENALNIKLTVVVSEVTNCRLFVATMRDGWVTSPSILRETHYPVARNDDQGSSCLI